MTDDRLTALEARVREMTGGASVSIRDQRVTNAWTWLLSVLGIVAVAALMWMANSVDNLNRNFAAFSEWKQNTDRRLENLERRDARP